MWAYSLPHPHAHGHALRGGGVGGGSLLEECSPKCFPEWPFPGQAAALGRQQQRRRRVGSRLVVSLSEPSSAASNELIVSHLRQRGCLIVIPPGHRGARASRLRIPKAESFQEKGGEGSSHRQIMVPVIPLCGRSSITACHFRLIHILPAVVGPCAGMRCRGADAGGDCGRGQVRLTGRRFGEKGSEVWGRGGVWSEKEEEEEEEYEEGEEEGEEEGKTKEEEEEDGEEERILRRARGRSRPRLSVSPPLPATDAGGGGGGAQHRPQVRSLYSPRTFLVRAVPNLYSPTASSGNRCWRRWRRSPVLRPVSPRKPPQKPQSVRSLVRTFPSTSSVRSLVRTVPSPSPFRSLVRTFPSTSPFGP